MSRYECAARALADNRNGGSLASELAGQTQDPQRADEIADVLLRANQRGQVYPGLYMQPVTWNPHLTLTINHRCNIPFFIGLLMDSDLVSSYVQ